MNIVNVVVDEMSSILFKQCRATGTPVTKTAKRIKFWVPKIHEDELHALRSQCGFIKKVIA